MYIPAPHSTVMRQDQFKGGTPQEGTLQGAVPKKAQLCQQFPLNPALTFLDEEAIAAWKEDTLKLRQFIFLPHSACVCM